MKSLKIIGLITALAIFCLGCESRKKLRRELNLCLVEIILKGIGDYYREIIIKNPFPDHIIITVYEDLNGNGKYDEFKDRTIAQKKITHKDHFDGKIEPLHRNANVGVVVIFTNSYELNLDYYIYNKEEGRCESEPQRLGKKALDVSTSCDDTGCWEEFCDEESCSKEAVSENELNQPDDYPAEVTGE